MRRGIASQCCGHSQAIEGTLDSAHWGHPIAHSGRRICVQILAILSPQGFESPEKIDIQPKASAKLYFTKNV